MKLSVVVAGRDDSYGDDRHKGIYDLDFSPIMNIERVRYCLSKNYEALKQVFVEDFELILVDWCPLAKRELHRDKELMRIPIRHIVVASSAAKSRNLNPKSFYEYFAKNVGIRNCLGEWVLVMNSDDFFELDLALELKSAVSEYCPRYIRPYSRKDVVSLHPLKFGKEGLSFGDTDLADRLGTSAAGDFLAAPGIQWLRAGGFNEKVSRPFSKNLRQSGLDGQMCVQFFLNGLVPLCLKHSINSIDHNKIERDYKGVTFSSYFNKENWGMFEREKRYVSEKVFEIR